MLLSILLLSAPAAPLQAWTVDDDGPADFTSIAAAIAAANPGDTLLIQPGQYGPFVLDKDLFLVGPAQGAKPQVAGRSVVDGAQRVTIAGLAFEALDVRNLGLRGIVDACSFSSNVGDAPMLAIHDCAEVEVSRCSAASSFAVPFPVNGAALGVWNSVVTVADSSFAGASGVDSSSPDYGDGGDGLYVFNSEVLAIHSTLVGGGAGTGCGFGCAGCSCEGDKGAGIRAFSGSIVTVRGSGQLLQGGFSPQQAASGAALVVFESTIVHSGVELDGGTSVFTGGDIIEPPQEPFLILAGGDAEGAARRLQLFGPTGEVGVLFVSPAAAQPLIGGPGVDGAFWLNPFLTFYTSLIVTQGGDVPVTQLWPVPPLAGLSGLSLYFQTWFPFVPGAMDPASSLLSNVGNMTFRF